MLREKLGRVKDLITYKNDKERELRLKTNTFRQEFEMLHEFLKDETNFNLMMVRSNQHLDQIISTNKNSLTSDRDIMADLIMNKYKIKGILVLLQHGLIEEAEKEHHKLFIKEKIYFKNYITKFVKENKG